MLLILSKRRNHHFVASLIDWRLFENPFLFLQDIKIPLADFSEKFELLSLLPGMFDTLMGNVWGDKIDLARDERIAAAWRSFDEMERAQFASSDLSITTREEIENVVVSAAFDDRHFSQWPVWNGKKETGTALLIGNIHFDLKAQLPLETMDSGEKQARDRLFETLSNFTDPYSREDEYTKGYGTKEFRCSVIAWNGQRSRPIISEEREFDLANLENLEHLIEGEINKHGIFRGRVKAFSRWLDGEIEILPLVNIPNRSDSKIGPFHLRLGTFEINPVNTTLPKELFSRFSELREKYSGFLVFRDGLRVMPYGREDNDFFEIEKRRTQHAGREYWASRRMFGRIALTRRENPNLRDKAGREGFIDNRAAKGLRDLVQNILMRLARRYFGTDSDIRKQSLPEIRDQYQAQKAEEDRKKLRLKQRKEFRNRLVELSPQIRQFSTELETFASRFPEKSNGESELLSFRACLSEYVDQHKKLSLGEAPRDLGTLEEEYLNYRSRYMQNQALLTKLHDSVFKSLESIKPKAPRDIAYSDLSRNAIYLQNRIKKWAREALMLLESEKQRVSNLVEERNKRYHGKMLPLIGDVEHGRLSLIEVLDKMSKERDVQDQENASLFEPYVAALESLKESIDLENMALYGLEQISELRSELERLNSLAQLGITVEIIGHELESLDTTISRGLSDMPKEIHSTEPYKAIRFAHEDLTNRLRFLSPLKLAGDRAKKLITGFEIIAYIRKFFGDVLERNSVHLDATNAFRTFRILEQPARIFPVFINLVNNSRYWVCQSEVSKRQILLSVANSKVIVSDDGPGVDSEDLKHLFTLFFTRKTRGGRGVGLYLCRANLAAGGHAIHYAVDERERVLSGANFVINFKGAEYV